MRRLSAARKAWNRNFHFILHCALMVAALYLSISLITARHELRHIRGRLEVYEVGMGVAVHLAKLDAQAQEFYAWLENGKLDPTKRGVWNRILATRTSTTGRYRP